MTWQDKGSHDMTRKNKTIQAWQDGTRQKMTRQNMTKQEKT
jgi:hypothetical protein